ncbi:Kelch repeat-containing protein [Maribacter sp. 2307ULW6-5]|uniref:Kelch repeat-containing protein n=1 Tax=Maribacter sp. 2307ULW6-5 TaxID=3386275 RepID=UPI0039BC3FE5
MKRRCFVLIVILYCCPHMVHTQSRPTNPWQKTKTSEEAVPRHENGFVRVGKHFYLLGGRGLKPVAIYNSKTKTWAKGQKPPLEIHHFQAVVHKGKIYVLGGMTGKYPHETPLANILVYDPKKDAWETGPNIPRERRRGAAGAVVHKGKAYLVSGIVNGHYDQHVPWVDRYDFKTKKWEVLADAPRSRDHFHAVVAQGKIYAVGGRNSSYKTKQTFELTIPQVDVYDVKKNTWQTLHAVSNLPTERAGTTSVIYKNHLIVLGGESGAIETAHDEVEALDLATMKWRKMPSLHHGRHGTQAILYKNQLYIATGSGNRGGRPELNSMEILDLNASLSKK